jgi:hypothetical protein
MPGFCRYIPHFKVFVTGPVVTGLDRFFAVFCGPGPWSMISEAFWDRFGPRFEPRRAQDRDLTGPWSTSSRAWRVFVTISHHIYHVSVTAPRAFRLLSAFVPHGELHRFVNPAVSSHRLACYPVGFGLICILALLLPSFLSFTLWYFSFYFSSFLDIV